MNEVQRYIVATLPGRMTRDCVEVVKAKDYDALKETLISRDDEIQYLRGANARKNIALSIADNILEDAEYEATSLDAEYWGKLHDKATALQRAHTALKAENERLREALREMMQWVDAALKAPHWHWDGDQREAAENEFACAKAALSAVPNNLETGKRNNLETGKREAPVVTTAICK